MKAANSSLGSKHGTSLPVFQWCEPFPQPEKSLDGNAMIDHERLAVIAYGSHRPAGEIIADFRQSNLVDTLGLHRACDESDFDTMALLAHRIKGACLMLGATGLAEACSLLSLSVRAHSDSNAREAMAFYDRESAALGAYLETIPESNLAVAPSGDTPAKLCAGLRFVVAEDHDFQRKLIMMLLRRAGAESVIGVEDGAQALEQVTDAGNACDILVLDLSMPGMDGSELLERLSERKSPVAVILNSALSPSLIGVVMQRAAAGNTRVLGVIGKPLTQAALGPLVEKFRADYGSQRQTALPGNV